MSFWKFTAVWAAMFVDMVVSRLFWHHGDIETKVSALMTGVGMLALMMPRRDK
jgi:hypothetical protein